MELGLLVGQIVSATELLNATGGIEQLLLSREEGMAVGADIQLLIANRGAYLEGVATGTGNRAYLIFGMDALFQCISSGSWFH
jgi:hypothetical protein